MYWPGDSATERMDEEYPIEVFRIVAPPRSVNDLLDILKVHSNGLYHMTQPDILKDLWQNIATAIKDSEKIDKMVWSRIPEAKFGFKMKNIFNMKQWKRKHNLKLASPNCRLSITKLHLESECQAIGYDLSKAFIIFNNF